VIASPLCGGKEMHAWPTKSEGPRVRDLETIDAELRLEVAARRSIREHGSEPSSRDVDELLDERLARRGRPGEDAAVDT
jgi:hypothetical protein